MFLCVLDMLYPVTSHNFIFIHGSYICGSNWCLMHWTGSIAPWGLTPCPASFSFLSRIGALFSHCCMKSLVQILARKISQSLTTIIIHISICHLYAIIYYIDIYGYGGLIRCISHMYFSKMASLEMVPFERPCASLLAQKWESICEIRRRAHKLRLAAWPWVGAMRCWSVGPWF